jgi:hypothetical protein
MSIAKLLMSTSTGRTIKARTMFTVAMLLALTLLGCSGDEPGDTKSDDLKARLERLRSVPYTSVAPEPAGPGKDGVGIHKADKAYGGYNLYCSGASPEALLMDMDGKIVHRWSFRSKRLPHWDHMVLLDNGDLLVANKFKHLLKLDWNSNLLWRRRMQVHHDIAVADRTIYVPLREIHDYRGFRSRFSAIAKLTWTGEEVFRWSTRDHLDEIKKVFDQRSFIDTILDSLLAGEGLEAIDRPLSHTPELKGLMVGTLFDYFHLNTITIIPENALGQRDPRFRAGNLLICFRNVNQIAVLDKDTWEILWVWGEGVLEWPHHPTMLDNGSILIFDNGVLRKFSRVVEVDPVAGRIEWEYVADPAEEFYTYEKGSAQRLPNGNTLVCDGDNGRAFEVTRAGEIVWEWHNPDRELGRRVTVYRMTRLPEAIIEPLLGLE